MTLMLMYASTQGQHSFACGLDIKLILLFLTDLARQEMNSLGNVRSCLRNLEN